MTLHNQIIQKRLVLILRLIKENKDSNRIEREAAFLVLDTIDGIVKKEIPLKEACHCFARIEYALNQNIRDQLSQEFEDMLNEGLLLDEINTKYGPDVQLLVSIATKILTKEKINQKTAKHNERLTRV